MKRFLSLFLVFALLIGFAPSVHADAAVKISKTKLTLEVGKSSTLKITGTTKAATWASSSKNVATVSKGKVTSKSVGTANITASVSGKKYTCKVTVEPKKYTEGQYKVGKDIKAGEYVIFSNKDTSGYFSLTSDANGDDIITNDNFKYNTIIQINDGEYLKLSRAYAVAIKDVKKLDLKGEGMFKIGTYLSAGEYKLEADKDSSGYYCIYSDNRHDDIVSNDNFKGSVYVTVEDGQYLNLSRCKIIE